MARSLNPYHLCNLYTIEQINEKITFYQDQLERATVKMYDKDSTQGRQKVESADIEKIESLLATWIEAKACKSGTGGTRVISGNFQGTRRGGF
jgi:hypothetical protein